MGFKLSSAIAIARFIIQDEDSTAYRISNDQFVALGNGALRSLPNVKPSWLYTEFDFTCATGAEQTLTEAYHSLVNVKGVKNGGTVLVADKPSLDSFQPGWKATTAGAAKNWMPYGDDPRRFFVYPPANNTQVLEVTAVRVPGPYTIDQDTGLPETITEAIADYMVGMAESIDDENVLSQRAAQFITQFAARIGGNKG